MWYLLLRSRQEISVIALGILFNCIFHFGRHRISTLPRKGSKHRGITNFQLHIFPLHPMAQFHSRWRWGGGGMKFIPFIPLVRLCSILLIPSLTVNSVALNFLSSPRLYILCRRRLMPPLFTLKTMFSLKILHPSPSEAVNKDWFLNFSHESVRFLPTMQHFRYPTLHAKALRPISSSDYARQWPWW